MMIMLESPGRLIVSLFEVSQSSIINRLQHSIVDVRSANALEGVNEGSIADPPAAEGVHYLFCAIFRPAVKYGVCEVG